MTTVETHKQKELFRRFQCGEMEFREADSRKLRFPASSEQPVERWYGNEVLSHEKGAVKLSRASTGAMPLLFNHDVNDPIGMITGAELKSGRMWVDAELFETERAAEISKMMAGGLRNVSLAYRVNELLEDKTSGTFTATDWEPYEVSIVTVPADPSVGIGRGAESEYNVRMVRSITQKEHAMTPEEEKAEAIKKEQLRAQEDANTNRLSGEQMEQRRKKAVETLCKANKLGDNYRDMFIGTGMSIEDVGEEILKIVEERGKTNPTSKAKIGMSEREVSQFSMCKAILALYERNWGSAQFELEAIQAATKASGKALDPNRILIPFDVLERKLTDEQREAAHRRSGRRDLTVASAGGGGYLVGTENMGFIELLRNRSVAFRMGARRLSGLTNNITIPRMSAAGTAYWINSEAQGATESQQTFQQVSLSPKTAGAYTEISRLLLLQSSPGAEGIVTDDLAQIIALAADLAALSGSGSSGQPTGILNASIGSVAGGSLNYDAVLECQVDLAAANVMPSAGGYVTTPAVAKLALSRQRFTSTDTPLWTGNIWDGNMSGFPAMSSNQMTASTLLFGDWPECVIGEWGVLEVEVNPYANFQAGIIGVRCMYSLDVAVRRPFAFTAMGTIS